MRKHFDEDLELLNEEMLQMSMVAEQAIQKAVQLVFQSGNITYEEIRRLEKTSDQLETKIQDHCLRLLLEQQPVASDLRWISATLKMITDLERIGDQANDIAEISKNFVPEDIAPVVDIKDMAEATVAMVHKAINAYVKRDFELAKSVALDDDTIDNFFVAIRDELVHAIKSEELKAERIIDLIMITKYLERIADHAVNISRWVVFAIEGFPTED
ncbi:phosphate signaling complex protein PhoU [Peptoniphilus equinus]|uniref:Phosphate-specific transport system accessory protein PhoU n=1 Tax=Peptoniphilus equinus TaxID=3016343 RepID=A0ABY7QU42_9FIRM|nr:phosphate signaling complex protein PhoU [Peptoniphilus equinus]WBW49688.1 phosphate signaling complex protein PhoU [Peptoniphilus equinus]